MANLNLEWSDFKQEIHLFENLTYVLPDPPNKSDIKNYGLPINKQKWYRAELPTYWTNKYLRKEAEENKPIIVQGTSRQLPNYNWWMDEPTDEMLTYAEGEWEKRLNGMWIWIKDQPIYLTGDNYYYLQWYCLDDGYPDFRYRDVKWFYAADIIDKDPKSLGMIYGKRRREGASFRGGSRWLNYTSRTQNATAGFQTKVGHQARNDFSKIFTEPLSKMPAFFIPKQSGTEKAKDGIFFYPPARRRTMNNSALGTGEDSLESSITWKTTVSNAFDGSKLHRYMIDEGAKMIEASLDDMWKVARRCLTMRGTTGKAYLCSTIIEDTTDEGAFDAFENWKRLWDQSDPTQRGPDGKTVSGLTRYFTPAYDGLEYEGTSYFDEWGFSKEDEAREFLDKQVSYFTEKGYGKDLNFFIRQYPRTWEESLRPSTAASGLDHEKIIACLQELESLDERGRQKWTSLVGRYDLQWTNGFGSDVKIVPSPNGRFYINQQFNKDIVTNKNRLISNAYGKKLLAPLNGDKFQFGIDPVNADKEDLSSNYFSLAACVGMRLLDPNKEAQKDGPEVRPDFGKDYSTPAIMLEYAARPNKVEDFFEDMVKMCHFFSAPVSVEKNQVSIINYFKEKGYYAFIDKKSLAIVNPSESSRDTKGNAATAQMHNVAFEKIQSHICDFCYPHLIPFPRLLNQLLKFDYSNHRILDLYCAFEQCLLGATKNVVTKTAETANFEMPTYKIRYSNR